MTVDELIKKAITEKNGELAGKIADMLRFKMGMNYDETYAHVNKVSPVTLWEWDELLHYADGEVSK